MRGRDCFCCYIPAQYKTRRGEAGSEHVSVGSVTEHGAGLRKQGSSQENRTNFDIAATHASPQRDGQIEVLSIREPQRKVGHRAPGAYPLAAYVMVAQNFKDASK